MLDMGRQIALKQVVVDPPFSLVILNQILEHGMKFLQQSLLKRFQNFLDVGTLYLATEQVLVFFSVSSLLFGESAKRE